MEKFNPKDEQYKEVADLPTEHQEEFMDVKGGGFVLREAIINQEIAEKMAQIEENKRELVKKRKAELLLRDKEEEEANEELIKELPEGELKDKVLDVIKKNVVMIKISFGMNLKKRLLSLIRAGIHGIYS